MACSIAFHNAQVHVEEELENKRRGIELMAHHKNKGSSALPVEAFLKHTLQPSSMKRQKNQGRDESVCAKWSEGEVQTNTVGKETESRSSEKRSWGQRNQSSAKFDSYVPPMSY